jgi:hypothetical protein
LRAKISEHVGTEQLATATKDNKIQQLIAVVQFMTSDKLQTLPNAITVKIVFGQMIGNKV